MSEERHHHDQDEVVSDIHDAEEQPPHQEEQPPHQEEQVPGTTPEQLVPDENLSRPRRTVKPSLKYSPDVYELSYVGTKPRLRSRRTIRRAGI